MSLETFFEQFELLADAPNGAQKLRELILQLAVQGKLVLQDPNDEPAIFLFEVIKVEEKRLFNEKKIRKPKPLPQVVVHEVPFDIPKSWKWIRLGEIGDWGAGATPDRKNSEYYGGSIRWFKSGELNDAYIQDSEENLTELALKKCSLRLNKPGDVLIAMYGATIGKVAILETEATTNQAVCACTCFEGFCNCYLLLLLKAYKNHFSNQGAGGDQPNISREKIIYTVAPLPPLEEQKRIVAKVEQLMKLCDELEERQKQRRSHLIQLNQGAIAQLLTAAPDEFGDCWQRICNNFDLLYSLPENIGKLRQAILQLAVQGKLVPQDPNDEPALDLLNKVVIEKEQFVEAKKIKSAKPLPKVDSSEEPFLLPQDWKWVRLQEIFNVITDGDHLAPPQSASGVPFLVISNVREGVLNFTATRFVSEEFFLSVDENRKPRKGDILYTVVGSYGIPVVVDTEQAFFVQRHIALLKSSSLLEVGYLKYLLKSPLVYNQATECATGIAQKTVLLNGLRRMIVPLPPHKEQKRIAAKVNHLMALCDELEAKLKQTQLDGENLMEVAVRQVLAA